VITRRGSTRKRMLFRVPGSPTVSEDTRRHAPLIRIREGSRSGLGVLGSRSGCGVLGFRVQGPPGGASLLRGFRESTQRGASSGVSAEEVTQE